MKKTDDVSLVFNGWLDLSADEQEEVERRIRKHKEKRQRKRRREKKEVEEEVRKIHLGPASDVCPCCGR